MTEKEKSKTKFGVYVPDELVRDLELCMKTTGIKSKSKLIQEALRLFIAEHRWRLAGKAVGIIGVVYNHDVGHVDEKLTDLQHEFLDIVVSTVHVHLDKEKCMLAIIVRGDTDRIKKLLNSIMGLRGVLVARPLLLETH